MSYGTAEAYRALARQAADQAKNVNARREKIQQRSSVRSGGDAPDEALACPACLTTYAFGSTCPDCDEALVSASLAEAAGPSQKRTPGSAVWELILGALIVVVSITTIYASYWLVAFLLDMARTGSFERFLAPLP